MLKVDNINVFYDNVEVLKSLSLKIQEDTLTVLVGPNGAGKTTLAKTISGLKKPRSGAIYFDENRIDVLDAYALPELGIAHVPEGGHLFRDMTVQENLRVGAHLVSDRGEEEELLEWVYELFPVLKERKNQIAKTLSGGERQMLAIGRGLMIRPKLMILDEPSLGLAPFLVQEVFDLVEDLRSEGITIFLLEQNVTKSLELADWGFLLKKGKITLEGDGDDLKENEEIQKTFIGFR